VSSLGLGVLLTLALLAGFGIGWVGGRVLQLAMPNVLTTTLVLTAGSLGAPVFTYIVLGRGALSYTLALLLAGVAAGITFWPMGQPQGRKQWL
jgi:hypothetical protein